MKNQNERNGKLLENDKMRKGVKDGLIDQLLNKNQPVYRLGEITKRQKQNGRNEKFIWQFGFFSLEIQQPFRRYEYLQTIT